MDEQVVRLGELPVAKLADESLFRLCRYHSICGPVEHMLKNKICGRRAVGWRWWEVG
jgi:hypothetical protein